MITTKGYAGEVKAEFEDCLENKLNYAIVSNDFIAQPNILLAKEFLERYMSDASIQCTSVFSDFKDLTITYDRTQLKSTIDFDAEEFNSITTISAEIYLPVAIKNGNKEKSLNKFSTGVAL